MRVSHHRREAFDEWLVETASGERMVVQFFEPRLWRLGRQAPAAQAEGLFLRMVRLEWLMPVLRWRRSLPLWWRRHDDGISQAISFPTLAMRWYGRSSGDFSHGD